MGPAGEVHSYFNPYRSPYKAQIVYHVALKLLEEHLVRLARADYCRFLERFRAPKSLCYHITLSDSLLEACSLKELREVLEKLPKHIAEEHVAKGYIDKWVREVLLAEGGLEYVRSMCPSLTPLYPSTI
jgi:hypothetical protein